MALEVKSLYDGQLSSTAKTMLYTVPTGKSAIVKTMRLVNTDTAEHDANLYYLRSGGDNPDDVRLITPSNVTIAAGNLLIEDSELTLGEGDQILGDASEASKVDCVISGIERDA